LAKLAALHPMSARLALAATPGFGQAAAQQLKSDPLPGADVSPVVINEAAPGARPSTP